MSNFVVLYDACVLYPASLRNLLMHLAVASFVLAGLRVSTMSGCAMCWLIARTSREKELNARGN